MLSFVSLPGRIIGILEQNVTPREIALGVCLGLFMGFIPLNGATALILTIFFFVFRINRMATILTLPLFKSVYLLGASGITGNVGSYLLERADYLTGFWRIVTTMPVVAYLDINNTLVAGGLAVSAILSIPVYFISKMAIIALRAKYSEGMKNSFFAKLTAPMKIASVVGSDAASTLKNVSRTARNKLIVKIKSAFIKPKAGPAHQGFLKKINVAGIALIVVVLLVIQLCVGLIVSPIAGAFIIGQMNKASKAKISVESINIWPLTLSFSMKGLKVFDPEETDKRVIKIDSASFKLSPLALLSKRIAFSRITMNGADIDLKGYSDGSFNLQHFAKTESAPEPEPKGIAALWNGAAEKRDWFGKIYGALKNKFSKASQSDAKTARREAKKVVRITTDLPKGRMVQFKTAKDSYLFEIKSLSLDNAHINVDPGNGRPVEVKGAEIGLSRFALDPENGFKLDGVKAKGEIFKDDLPAGKFNLLFSKIYTKNGQDAVFNAEAKDLDLDAVRFIYEDSLPVRIMKGTMTISSKTRIADGGLESKNLFILRDHMLEAKGGISFGAGFIPMPALCDALNRINPVELNFTITGTIDRPQLSGFQDTLLTLVKPYVADVQKSLQQEGVKAIQKLFKQ